MKIKYFFLYVLLLLTYANAQRTYTVNSLADDQYSYSYDDPNTPEDESTDGICRDELGRCTLRAAIDEAWNMNEWADIVFSASGTIDLTDILYLSDNSVINGGNNITLASGGGLGCLEIDNNCSVKGISFTNTFYGLTINGYYNRIGDFDLPNEFLNCYIGIVIDGDSNNVANCYVGITTGDILLPNQIGILVIGTGNKIGQDLGLKNIICGNSIAGIMISDSGGNQVQGSYIGTNKSWQTGLGNAIGIMVTSPNNLIGADFSVSGNVISGNQIGISMSGAPPEEKAEENKIKNNMIGLSRNGDVLIPNGSGISITNGVYRSFIIDNVIAGNTNVGISLLGYDTDSFLQTHFISGNRIGINEAGVLYPNGYAGISLVGFIENIFVGFDPLDEITQPNIIVGNSNTGIEVKSEYGGSPDRVLLRKNIIYQNGGVNYSIDPQSNQGFAAPYGLSLSGNILSGIHDQAGAVIDVYKDNRSELTPSAYQWLGSATTNANGIFTFEITDPSIESVSLTASYYLLGGRTSPFTTFDLVTNIEDEIELPLEYSLKQNFPNPFNNSSVITYSIPKSSQVSLKVYDILGNEIVTLVNEYKAAGRYEAGFTDNNLTSGIYFYKIIAGNFVETKKMILIR